MNLDYNPTTKRYTIDGQTATRETALLTLRAEGLTEPEARRILRAYETAATIEHRLPPRPPDRLTGSEAVSLLVAVLLRALDRARNLPKADRWIRANLKPTKRPGRSAYGLKHVCDSAYQKTGQACYLHELDFIDCLRKCGFAVTDDGRVYAREVTR